MPLPVCLAWQVLCRPRVRLLPQVPQSRVLSPFRLQFLRLRLRLRLRQHRSAVLLPSFDRR